jgi:hypothetical protein
MAWSVDTIYGCLRFLLNKNQAGGISATDFFYAWNIEQYAYHEDLVGKWEARANGKGGINTGLIQNEVTMTKLLPFTIPVTLSIAAGQGIKPLDLIYTLALRINGVKVVQVDHDQLSDVMDDVIDPASIADNKYYYTEYLNYYSFLPIAVTNFSLDYVASCTDVVWGYSFDENGRQVYDPTPGISVQPKWGQNTIVDITKRALTNLGVHFTDQSLTEYGKSNIITGDS